jgi:ADP-ribose pyrophosphatase YjhB (NUDIX family)
LTARFYYGDPHAPAPNRPIGVGALALVERDGTLLMDRRSDCGRWGLPGGLVERGEAIPDALRREVREETGLTVVEAELFAVFQDPSRIVSYPDGNTYRIITFAFRAGVEDYAPLRRSEESLELRFVPRGELADLDVIETTRPIVDRYLVPAGQRPVIFV